MGRHRVARPVVTAECRFRDASAGRLRWAAVVLIAGSWVANHGDANAGLGTAGVNLSWDNCGAFGTLNKDFSCATNSAAFVLVPSVVTPFAMSPTSMTSVIHLFFNDQVPDWWALQSAGCRVGALSSTPGAAGLAGCLDYFGIRPSSSVMSWNVRYGGGVPNGYFLRLICWTDPQYATQVPGGTEIYGGRILIDARKTVGVDSCSGCSLRGDLIYTNASIESLEFPGGGWSTSREATRNYVWWQNSLVPTVNTSWGSIKAMYR